MPDRRVHLGIDYGTSYSKIIFRDYAATGEESAFVSSRQGEFRIPSSVAVSGSHLVFGTSPQDPNARAETPTWYESVKMRVAGEVTGNMERYFYGPQTSLPAGFSARDLAVLTVWFLVSEGHRQVHRYLGAHSGSMKISMTMGLPMSFYRDEQLRATFLDISRAAWCLYRDHGEMATNTLSLDAAKSLLENVNGQVAAMGAVAKDELRYWIRSEAEAAMWLPFQSPAVLAGPYAKVDIGAGTTNASVFRIVERPIGGRWVRDRLAFFGAYSHPIGTDALDRALAQGQNLPEDQSLTLRGEEDRILNSVSISPAVSRILEEIYEAYRRAWILAFEKIRGAPAELDQFGQHGVFMLGGGSLVEKIRRRVRVHPGRGVLLEALRLEWPRDLRTLDGGDLPTRYLPFLAVAYGLSHLALAIPEVETPDEVPPLPESSRTRERLDRDDIYAK